MSLTSWPAATVTIGGTELSSADAGVSRLVVSNVVGGGHDQLTAILAPGSQLAGATAMSAVSAQLGYGTSLTDAFTGALGVTGQTARCTVVTAYGPSAALSKTRVGRSYVQQSVADVVGDLLNAGNVPQGQVDAPNQLGCYAVDERRPVWDHLRALAQLTGLELSTGADGSVNFRPPRTGDAATVTLNYGADLLGWDVRSYPPPGQAPAVVPYGAASQLGADLWHIVLREPDGGPPASPTIVPPAIRDADSANAVGDALGATAARHAISGYVLVVGTPTIRAGDVVTISGIPPGDVTVRIIEAVHELDDAGFRTQLRVEGTG
jgi:hypothetical protein